ncbi:Adenylate kinase [Granulicella pectinivorans]|uniref:Adenylate kinase n=1 Tax=Granulicella pectinivorans TaxID=474950 RepID=A0A1I6MYQ9_9BACT|nr:adenylate kinase [Granulicella pectinivorans]SFS20840.1 Adenylate kinase [Granulicella pectinivorans]
MTLASSDFVPGPLLLLGAPGVGKGTQAQILVAEYGIPQISTGEILRRNIAEGTELGLKAKDLMAAGQFVDDDTVNGMVRSRLAEPDVLRGYILDGYPRTLAQANWLDAHLAAAHATSELPLVAVSIQVDETDLLHRITGRRICPTCKCSYNIYSQPPLVPGICDHDGAALIQRPDDTEEAFEQRMKEYAAKTVHVIDHYRGHGRFEEVDGSQPIEAVTAAIHTALKKLRGQKEE